MKPPVRSESDQALHEGILRTRETGEAVRAVLETDAQVIARVTDGIYRHPASAFRELISNAYDADATQVVIHTDRPRFKRTTVSDNGNGMGPAAVAHLIRHIGGSAKRSADGAALGITQDSDPFFSPGGRRLIGKIGIGLFSVSQLTQSFQIVTKISGEAWRTVAAVTLRQFSDAETHTEGDPYEAGLVSIWQEPAHDVESQGTTIVLNGLKPAARSALRSAPAWLRVNRRLSEPPKYHVGAVLPDREFDFGSEGVNRPELPWFADDDPLTAFRRFVDAVSDPYSSSKRNPKLPDLVDYYLQMIWQLSLAAPLPYIDQHPFDDPLDGLRRFTLDGTGPSGVTEVFSDGSFSDAVEWPHAVGVTQDFSVLFDDLELRRPLKFRDLPRTSNAVKTPMLFVGHLRESFDHADVATSGGPLEFYAYFLWTPKVVPTDKVGSLIRIHGASGTGFDETFLRYQVAETTRLTQISCEVFVVEGLESALNIDRESFNFAHPHVERLTNWLHMALSRSIGAQKQVANQLQRQGRGAEARKQASELEALVAELWEMALAHDADSPIPPVEWDEGKRSAPGRGATATADADAILLSRQRVLGAARASQKSRRTERQLAAITQMLAAFELLDELDDENVELLLRYIARVLTVAD